MRHTLLLTFGFALPLLVSCGSGTGSVSLAIKVAGTSRLASLPLSLSGRSMQTDGRSFTPTSFKLPIMKISIAKASGNDEKTIYNCPGATEADCLVDLASQTELDAISAAARSVSIPADTYSVVNLSTCAAGSSGSTTTIAKITGSATGPDSGNWVTDATHTVNIAGTTAAETEVGNWACSTKSVIVKDNIVVGSDPLTLTVVVDNYMGAVFNSNTSSGMGGCKVIDGGANGNGLCVTYPALMAYVGTETATTKRFSIAHNSASAPGTDATANALIIVAMTESGTPLMAYGRTLFTSTSETCAANTKTSSEADGDYTVATGGPTYVTETNYNSFAVNTDGTIAFEQGGSADTYAAKFAAFDVTATSTGTVTSKDGADSWFYRATLIP